MTTPGNADRRIGGNSTHAEETSGAQRDHRGWYCRGYLPHADFPDTLQSVTYRLWDSLPQSVLAQIDRELSKVAPQKIDSQRRQKIEAYIDAGYGCCVLADPFAARLVMENWKHFDGVRYDLIAWVVMPNHVHVLIRAFEGIPLASIIQSWKNYTSYHINKAIQNGKLLVTITDPAVYQEMGVPLPGAGTLWMRDYWDRFIRNEEHYHNVIRYIHNNPVKAGLVKNPDEWPYSSATPPGTPVAGSAQ